MADAFIEHLHDLFAALGPIGTRAMFGGHGVYFDGLIIGIVIDDALYLKVDDQSRAQFEAAGCAPFVYKFDQSRGQQQPITMSYWSLPEDAMDSPQAMLPWAKLAFAAALRKPRPPKKARKPVGKDPR
jgi:DNA transformation protein